jgi:hypothetical protein
MLGLLVVLSFVVVVVPIVIVATRRGGLRTCPNGSPETTREA